MMPGWGCWRWMWTEEESQESSSAGQGSSLVRSPDSGAHVCLMTAGGREELWMFMTFVLSLESKSCCDFGIFIFFQLS